MTPRGIPGRTRAHPLGVTLALAAVTALLVLAIPGRAQAHALLTASEPADATQLDAPPEAITLSFTEPPDPALSTLRLVGPGGAEVQVGAPATTPARPLDLAVEVGPLEEGVYTVTWRTVSRVDGHPSAGVLTFGVGVPVTSAPSAPPVEPAPPTSPVEIVGRLLLFVGLGALLGAAVVGVAAFPVPPRRIMPLGVAGAAASVVAVVLLTVAQRSAAGVPLGALLGTSIGRSLVWRAVPVVVGTAAAAVALGIERRRRPLLVVAGVAASVAMYAHVAAGHAAGEEGDAALQVVGQWAHVIAASVWLGGLASLIVAIRGEPREDKTAAARRYSAAAGIALAVVFVTGVVRSIDEVGSWGDLFGTGYGQLVIVKIALILALAGLGAINRYRTIKRMDISVSGLRRIGGIELVLAVGAVAVAAVLAAVIPPATVPAAARAPAAIVATGSDFATSVRARLEVDPGIPGANTFRLRVEDFDTGEPVEAEVVVLRFASVVSPDIGETQLELSATDDGAFEGTGGNLATAGPFDVTAVVQAGAESVEVPLEIATVCSTQAVEEEGQPTVHLFQTPAGTTTEGYVIPLGRRGTEVHFTFLDPAGKEARVAEIDVVASRAEGDPVSLDAFPLTKGHYVAEAQLEPGTWRFDAAASTAAGEPLSGCFEESLGG